MRVRELMTAKVETIRPNELLSSACERMRQGQFRRLPVVDDTGNLLGIITDGDLREQSGYLSASKVTAAMSEPAITVRDDAEIGEAARLLLERKIGGVPVVDGTGRMVGILTESDLIRGLLQLLSKAAA